MAECVNCKCKFDLKKDPKSVVIHAQVKGDDGPEEMLFYVCGDCSVYIPGANDPEPKEEPLND